MFNKNFHIKKRKKKKHLTFSIRSWNCICLSLNMHSPNLQTENQESGSFAVVHKSPIFFFANLLFIIIINNKINGAGCLYIISCSYFSSSLFHLWLWYNKLLFYAEKGHSSLSFLQDFIWIELNQKIERLIVR